MTTLRRRLVGLLALMTIAAIVGGLPVVLIAVGANPFAGGLPPVETIWDVLTSPDDGTLAIALFTITGWVAWAFLTVSITLEVFARARGQRVPTIRGFALPQRAARGLVGATLMLFIAAPGATAVTAPPPMVATQTIDSAPAAPAAAPVPVQAAPSPDEAVVTHTVQRGETLWSIAEQHLGNGHRYREILDLNHDLLGGQPDFLKVGWVLTLPSPTPVTPAATVVVEKGDTLSEIARDELGDATRYPEIFEASRGITQPGGRHLTDPDVIDVGWTLAIPADTPNPTVALPSPEEEAPPPEATTAPTPAPQPAPAPVEAPAPQSQPATTTGSIAPETTATAPTTAPGQGPAEAPASEEHLLEGSAWMVRTTQGVGSVLAAGVITLLAARRRTQQRRRRPGQRMPLPTGHLATAEQTLRATADPLSVENIDLALRSLALTCARTATPLPVVRAARLTATQFDLYLAEPSHLPTPWVGTADTTVWTLTDTHIDQLTVVTDVPAPYPALVTIGHDDEDGHVLLNLEHLGTLGVTGDDPASREILAALAIELATSPWADDLQVTLVGVFPELEDVLQTGRIRYLPSVGRVLEDLLHRAEEDRRALAEAGVPDLNTARTTGVAADAWPPEILVLAGNITDRQRNQLEQLVEDLPRVAVAAITRGVTAGEWGIDLAAGDSHDVAVLAPINLRLRPQRLPAAEYGHLLQVMALADVDELGESSPPPPPLADVATLPGVDVALEVLEAAAREDDAATPSGGSFPFGGVLLRETARPDGAAEPPEMAEDTGVTEQLEPAAQPEVPPEDSEDDSIPDTTAMAPVRPMPLPPPRILVLGQVDITNTGGEVEPSKRARLLEYAAYLVLHPGATHTAIDDAIWPDRRSEDNLNTRNPATSKLRRWVGTDPDGREYLPRHQAGAGYAFLPAVTSDVDDWDRLLQRSPLTAPTENLEAALRLVRGIPFEGTHRRRYAWAEPLKQRLISEIVDASFELTRRRLMEGRWLAAEQAVVVGLRVEPAQENLWRLRILAAHESRNPVAETEAIDRLLTITEQLECDLEPETEQLLTALRDPATNFDQLMANAL